MMPICSNSDIHDSTSDLNEMNVAHKFRDVSRNRLDLNRMYNIRCVAFDRALSLRPNAVESSANGCVSCSVKLIKMTT